MKTLSRTVSLLCLFLFAGAVAFAQSTGGSVSGTVTDPNGGNVAGAKITARQDSTGRQLSTVTTSEGLYAFPNLDIGSYTLTVEATGFKKLSQTNVVIQVSSRTAADLKLEIGDVNQTVTVTAEASQLQTQSAEIGVNFSAKLFRDAPFSAGGIRNPEQFVSFQPGVVNGAG
ncbi:MAG: carboxypeptidase-like regulatory domain-containing protein, partial [Acidobacteriota bacterium]|nr:carboxypeptidase-like regulatory domain-containing protein [Acidobacteriota bacterium]